MWTALIMAASACFMTVICSWRIITSSVGTVEPWRYHHQLILKHLNIFLLTCQPLCAVDEGGCAPALADDPRPVLPSYISLRSQLCDVHTISGSREAQIGCARVLAQLAFDAGMFSLSTRLQHWAYTLASQKTSGR